jgi:PAS domain S-box-containing protein
METSVSKRIWLPRFVRRPTIRGWLVFLVMAAIAPLIAFITVVLAMDARRQEKAVEDRSIVTARVLALAVERDLRTIEAALQVLARSPLLDTGEWEAFYDLAAEVGRMHGGWVAVHDRNNQEVMNTGFPQAAALPPGARMTSADVVLETAEPMVSDLFVGMALPRPVIPVIVPVTRGGEVRFLLLMGLLPERIAELLTAERIDPARVAVVFDRVGHVVAHVPDGGLVGRMPVPELVAAIRREREGWLRSTTVKNTFPDFAFARVPHADWTVALGILVGGAHAPAKRSLYVILTAAAAMLVLAPVLALRWGRRLTVPLAALAAAARRGESGAPIPELDATVAEVAELRQALHDATEIRARGQAERQRRVDEDTRRRIAEQTLAAFAASEERWRALFEQASEAIVIGDLSGICRNANAAACDVLGFTGEELVGASLSPLVSATELARITRAFISLRPGATLVDEWTLTRKDRETIVVEVNGRMLSDGRWQAFIRDITERRRTEDERVQLLAVTQAAQAEAEAASRMKDEFLVTLSHELRTPLNSMVGWLRLLRSGKLDSGRAAHALDVIERNVEAQSLLIRDLLDLTRIMRGNLMLDLQEHALSRVVTDACEALAPDADAKGITLECVVEPGIEGMFDANRIQQVVWNLVTNALKFTSRGGRVDVRLARAVGNSATLTVADNGCGIPPDFLPHVFERFRQLDVEGTTVSQGLGVGLAIVKHLVERHEGTVTAESPGRGQGATFTVTLPLRTTAVSADAPKIVNPPHSACA